MAGEIPHISDTAASQPLKSEPDQIDTVLLHLMLGWAEFCELRTEESLAKAQATEAFVAQVYEIPEERMLAYSTKALDLLIRFRLEKSQEDTAEL